MQVEHLSYKVCFIDIYFIILKSGVLLELFIHQRIGDRLDIGKENKTLRCTSISKREKKSHQTYW